ncbi:MAG: 2OG-Fe(II) oxygenase [Myxococcota bacterium]|nr:2OG-Fe(II) oxygenase [Myxococcota bacterium]
MDVAHYIRSYDDAFDGCFCDELIARFEDEQRRQRFVHWDGLGSRALEQVPVSELPEWEATFETLLPGLWRYEDRYLEDCQLMRVQWPVIRETRRAFGPIHLKRYLPNGEDEFRDHVDITTREVSERWLAFILYLNDIPEGGDTVFPQIGLTIQPRRGRLVLFPPYWMFVHRGDKPVGAAKYILQGFSALEDYPERAVSEAMQRDGRLHFIAKTGRPVGLTSISSTDRKSDFARERV